MKKKKSPVHATQSYSSFAAKQSNKPAAIAAAEDNEKIALLLRDLHAHELELDMQNEELRNSQILIEESRSRFSDLYDSSPIASFVLSDKGCIEEANLTASELLGLERCILMKLPFQAFIDNSSFSPFLSHLAKVISTRDKGVCELLITPRGGGTPFPALMQSSFFLDARNIPLCRCSLIDITTRNKAEEVLEKARIQTRAIVDNIPDMVWLKDSESRYVEVNQAFGNACGRKPEDLVGKTDLDLWPGELAQRYRADDRDVMASGMRKKVEEPLTDHEGKLHWMETIKTPIMDRNGIVTGTTGIARDITERRKSKEELRILSSHLQNVREEERASIAREIHDHLGQLLTALKMDLTWLCGKLPEAQKHLRSRTSLMLGDIDSAIDTVHNVITRLRPVILDDFGITAAIIWHAGDWQARTGISCSLSLSSEEISLPGNIATALFRICQETLTNVARHSGATEVKVSLMEKRSTITLAIEDNGRGITGEQSRGAAALGILGMRERAYSLGGEVIIHGVKGKGTTLEATFPLEKRK
ncbi:MAG: PAS domain S-box protein [Candidatus Eremiobacteraeota bacterium]|nr:PAS domain S-box protein [Candidatus Eremiobacteraeota bacterium]